MKLTAKQQELLDAMKAGMEVMYHPYMGRFNPQAYYSAWTPSGYSGPQVRGRCTVAAKGLLKAGLVKKIKEDWRGHQLVPVDGSGR